MSVKLVSYTKCDPEYFNGDDFNLEELIAFCARVSNPANQMNKETSEKLLKYCIDHKHWSIFEMVDVCLEVKTTRDIGRQMLRHSLRTQEFSQRYSNPTLLDHVPYRECRMQDSKNRQSSLECGDKEIEQWWYDVQEDILHHALEVYESAIKKGIAKEVARVVLPEGLTPTTMYFNGPIRTWIHLIEVRTDPSTQKEFRIIAEQCAEQIAKVFPMIMGFVHSQE